MNIEYRTRNVEFRCALTIMSYHTRVLSSFEIRNSLFLVRYCPSTLLKAVSRPNRLGLKISCFEFNKKGPRKSGLPHALCAPLDPLDPCMLESYDAGKLGCCCLL